jgi:hypothetical protein
MDVAAGEGGRQPVRDHFASADLGRDSVVRLVYFGAIGFRHKCRTSLVSGHGGITGIETRAGTNSEVELYP